MMLPPAASFRFPWELNSAREGESVRTFGRWDLFFRGGGSRCFASLKLICYQPGASRATLSAQHASKEHRVCVHTVFVEPFDPIIGAQYLVLGELENYEGVGVMVRARVLNCVDGVNIALLQKAVDQQRSFFKERDSKQAEVTPPAGAT